MTFDFLRMDTLAVQFEHPVEAARKLQPPVGQHASSITRAIPPARGLRGVGETAVVVASLLGLGFPGGPAVEREAAAGDPKAFKLPRSFLREERLDFSFSGLKTAVLYSITGQDAASPMPPLSPKMRADLAASFQQAVVDVLVEKSRQALRKTRLTRLAVGGGVAANRTLRASLESMVEEEGAELHIPPPSLCTDNAAMAAQAVEKWRAGLFAPLDLDATPN